MNLDSVAAWTSAVVAVLLLFLPVIKLIIWMRTRNPKTPQSRTSDEENEIIKDDIDDFSTNEAGRTAYTSTPSPAVEDAKLPQPPLPTYSPVPSTHHNQPPDERTAP